MAEVKTAPGSNCGDIWRTLDGFAQQAKEHGHKYVVLVLTKRKAGRRGGGAQMQVMPGLSGRFVSENDAGAPLVDVALDDLTSWLDRHRAWSTPSSAAADAGKDGGR